MGQPVKQFFTSTLTTAVSEIKIINLNASGNRSTNTGTEGMAFRTELMMPQRLTNGGHTTEVEMQLGDNAGNNWNNTGYYNRRYNRYDHTAANQGWSTTNVSWSGSYTYSSALVGRFVGAGGNAVGDEYDGVNSVVMDWYAPTVQLGPVPMYWGAGMSVGSATDSPFTGEVFFYSGSSRSHTYSYGFGSNGGSFKIYCNSGNFPIGTQITMYEFTRANNE